MTRNTHFYRLLAVLGAATLLLAACGSNDNASSRESQASSAASAFSAASQNAGSEAQPSSQSSGAPVTVPSRPDASSQNTVSSPSSQASTLSLESSADGASQTVSSGVSAPVSAESSVQSSSAVSSVLTDGAVRVQAIRINTEAFGTAMTLTDRTPVPVSVSFFPSGAANKRWKLESSNPEVVTVGAVGNIAAVTAVANGSVVLTVTAEDGGLTDSVILTVALTETSLPTSPGAVSYSSGVLAGVDAERQKLNLASYRVSDELMRAAQIRAEECASLNSLTVGGQPHVRPDGSQWHTVSPYARMENLAYGYGSAEVVAAWMASDGHRACILSSYEFVGVGYALSADGTPFAVMLTGTK